MEILKRFVIGEVQNNTAIVKHNDDVILIDAPYPPRNIINYLKDHKLELKYIFITHIHFDHIAGVSEIIEHYPDAKVFVSPKEKSLFNNAKENLSYRHNVHVDFRGELLDYRKLDLEGVKIKYISGHSKQSAVICFDQVIFSGDTLFRDTIGRSDLPHGDYERLVKEIKAELLGLDPETKVYPGHGFATTIKHEIENNELLK